MYPVLYRLGFASQPDATGRNDGMILRDLWITAAVRCAPPDNKPLPSEIANCARYTDRELAALRHVRVVVALGKIAFDACLDALRRQSVIARKAGYLFGHAAEYIMPNGLTLLASYHPSNQNTATGKLTTAMFESVFIRARELAIRTEV
jgi:uracil-DNA glycosylase family 4